MTPAYPPLNTLKPVAGNVWIVDGPAIRFGLPGLKLPFPTRMTVIRLDENRLFIHSPTPPTPTLRDQIAAIGTPTWIIGPNRLHYSWIPDWQDAWPAAAVYLAPRIQQQAKAPRAPTGTPLAGAEGYPWDGPIATLPVPGRYMTEYVFFHRPTRTLLLTDLIENFEPATLGLGTRCLARLGGTLDPHGSTPRDMRLTFPRHTLKTAAETMLAWHPERILLAHGRCYPTNAEAELRRAFRWVLRK